MAVKDAEIAFSPGFRWGTTILPGQMITREDLMDQVAITYPATSVNLLSGSDIKSILEDVADNLFNPDPYYQQGGDMVRVGGLTYSCTPQALIGSRIADLRLKGRPIDASKRYKVAGWASVAEGIVGGPIGEVMEQYFRSHATIKSPLLNQPVLHGMNDNPGIG